MPILQILTTNQSKRNQIDLCISISTFQIFGGNIKPTVDENIIGGPKNGK